MQHEKWVTLDKAREYTGHDTNSGLDQFCRRWNRAEPSMLILRRPGFVDMVSLKKAITEQVNRYTPGMQARLSVSRRITETRKRRTRANESAAMKGYNK